MVNAIQVFPRDGIAQARRILHNARAVICDIDGVLLSCGQPIAGAQTLLQHHRCVFVSNNSTHTTTQLSQTFARLALPATPSEFFLAGELALEYVHNLGPDVRVMLLASDSIAQKATQMLNVFDPLTLQPTNRPDIVLLCRDQTATFEKIQDAANAIRLGAKIVVSNPDLTHPANDGMIHTETGALWHAIQAQIQDCEPLAIIGKPSTTLTKKALEHLQLLPHEVVFLGDNLQTDALTAARLQIPFIHTGGEGFVLESLVQES